MTFIQRQLAMSVGVVRSLQVNCVKAVRVSVITVYTAIIDSGHNYHVDGRNSMNGWQRLWVVACLATGIPLAATVYKNMPDDVRLTDYHQQAVASWTRDLERATEKANANPGPRNDYGDETVASVKAKLQKEDENYKKELAQLPSERREYIIACLSLWVGFSVSLYVIGWLMGWVYRGFRPKRV